MDLTRKAVRHGILRAQRARAMRDPDAVGVLPVMLEMHPDTLAELLIDNDPDELRVLDFEGLEFMGIPIQANPARAHGDIAMRWPTAKKGAAS